MSNLSRQFVIYAAETSPTWSARLGGEITTENEKPMRWSPYRLPGTKRKCATQLGSGQRTMTRGNIETEDYGPSCLPKHNIIG